MQPAIRPVEDADCEPIARIYNHYIAHTVITFEEQRVEAQDIAQRVREVGGAGLPWLVAEHHGVLAGYACASSFHKRSAYRFTAEATIYLDPTCTARGIGTALYTRLLEILRAQSVRAVIGAIALPNDASIALHERLGFVRVGQLAQVGFKHGRWIDVGYWQLLFEPR